jgi:hypothetical protein
MLTELGKDIVGHTDEAKFGSSLRELLLKPKVFQRGYREFLTALLPFFMKEKNLH